MGVTLHIEAGYVVVDVGDGLVLEGHGGREVFVVGKSGSATLFLVAFEGYQSHGLAAYVICLQSGYFPSKKKGEEQLFRH